MASAYLAMLSPFAVSMIRKIVFAAGEIDLFDFAAAFLGKIFCRLRAFGIVFDFANAPFGQVHGHNEQHADFSHGVIQRRGASVKTGEGRIPFASYAVGTHRTCRDSTEGPLSVDKAGVAFFANLLSRSLLGVKRTWPLTVAHVRFDPKSQHLFLRGGSLSGIK